MALRVIETRQLIQIFIMFMIVQFFGLFLATQVFSGATYSQIASAQVVSSPTGALFYIAYIVLFSVVLIFLLKIYKGDKLFIILEGVIIFIASFFVFLILFSIVNDATLFIIYGNPITTSFILGIIFAIALVIAKNKMPKLRNTAAIIASVGVGVVLGISFGFFVALAFMAILAVYDFIAVFITKHMITMAKAVSNRNLAFLIGVNEVEALPESKFSKQELQEYEKERKELEKKSSIFTKLYKEHMVPVAARIELGTGDLAVPLMVAISAYKLSLNFILSFFIIFGAVFGLFLTAVILRKYKRALPAIPPLLFGVVIGIVSYIAIFNIFKL